MKSLIIPAIIVTAWCLADIMGFANPVLLPSIQDTMVMGVELLMSTDFWIDVSSTLARMFAGYLMAAFIGILLGALMGSFTTVYEITLPVVDFFRSTPVTILYPLFVLLLGVGSPSKIAMIFTACVFVIALNTAYGVLGASKLRAMSARLYGASPLQIIFYVTIWDALPQIMVGLRISISFALIVSILVEMFMGSNTGIGQRVIEAFTAYRIPEMYMLIIYVGLLGYLINRMFAFYERKLVGWSSDLNASS